MIPSPSPSGGPEPPDHIGWFIHGFVIFLLFISFVYVLCRQFVSDVNLFDLLALPPSDPNRLTVSIDPPCDLVPSVFDPSDLSLTLVIPACLAVFLDDAADHFTSRQGSDVSFSWEILVVAGSSDPIPDASTRPGVRVLRMPFPVGPGEVAQVGGARARGRVVGVAYSTVDLSSLAAVEAKLAQLCGSTHYAVVHGGGLLLCSRNAARWIFPNLHIRGGAFVAEARTIAHSRSIAWHEMAGQSGAVGEALDRVRIAAFYGMEIWAARVKVAPASLDQDQ